MVSKRPVTKAASAAAVMSILAVPSAVMAQPAIVTPPAILHPIQDLTLAKGTEITFDASQLGSFRVNSSVSSVVYATYSNKPKFINLRGLDKEGPSVITITDDANDRIVEKFKVHVVDAGADQRIDIGDITKYIASHPADVTQAADVRALLNGIEPFNTSKVVNTPPTVRLDAIPLINVTENSPVNKQIDLSHVFSDDFFQLLHFSIVENDSVLPTGLTASVSGQHLIVSGTPTQVGDQFKIVVKATEPGPSGASVQHKIEVHVAEQVKKPVPELNGLQPALDWKIGESQPQTVTLSTYFKPIDSIAYTIEKIPAFVKASIHEGILTISDISVNKFEGEETEIKVKATNKNGSAILNVPISLKYPIPAVIGEPDIVTLINGQESEAQTINLSDYFNDTGILRYGIEENPYVTGTIGAETGELTISRADLPVNEDKTEYIKVTATNIYGKSATLKVVVNITAKSPEVLTEPGTVTMFNGYTGQPRTVNMATYFRDTAALSYSFVENPYLSVTIDEFTGELKIQSANLPVNETLETSLQVQATNTSGKTATVYVPVLIEAVSTIYYNNHTPMPYALSLSELFADTPATHYEIIQGPGGELTAAIENNDSVDAQLIFNGKPLDTSLVVRAINTELGISKDRLFKFKINYRPYAIDVPVEPILAERGTALIDATRDLNGLFTDEPGQALIYTVDEMGMPHGLIGSVEDGILRVSGTPEISGTFHITVSATDPYGLSAIKTIEAKVFNRPVLSVTPEPVEWIYGVTENHTLDASEFFGDDGGQFTYSIEKPSEVTATINRETGELVIHSVGPATSASTIIKAKASNGMGTSATVDIPLQIKHSNIISWNSGHSFPYTIDLASHFTGTGATQFQVHSSYPGVIAEVIEGTQQIQLSGTPADTLLTVKGTNASNNTTTEVILRFVTDYAAPVMDGTPTTPETIEVTNGAMFEETVTPYLPGYFEDQNVTFEVMPYTNPAGNIDARIGDGFLRIRGAYFPHNVNTTTSIDVKVTNERNKSTIVSFPIVVEAMPAPEVIATPELLIFQDGINTSYPVYLGSYFENADDLDFIVENKDELREQYNIRASMDGDLYVENVAPIHNTEDLNLTVNIRATDRFNQSGLLQIPITIKPNTAPIVSPDSINTIYMDAFDDEKYNVIDLKLLNLFKDADEGDRLSNYSVVITGPVTGYVTADQYLFLIGDNLESGASVTVSAQDKAGHSISKTIQIEESPIGDTYSGVFVGAPFHYDDSFIPALPTDPEDQSRKMYLVDLINHLSYNTTYNEAAGANEIVITNDPQSLNLPSNVTLHYVNKIDHTLTLDVFEINISL